MKISKVISGVWNYIWGNIFFRVLYDKKYLDSRFFKNKYFGIGAIGWKWVISDFWGRLILKTNIGVPFPISPKIAVINPDNIHFDMNDLNNFQGQGKYFQAIGTGHIYIGKGSWIAPNVGIITTNHNVSDLSQHLEGKDVRIGELCWIGMNSVILPGVELGSNTIVGAGSVVTKSFANGNCVIAGNPAKVIRTLD
jgi:acetyltransferase-like isoleucine patch superfamily enzyme